MQVIMPAPLVSTREAARAVGINPFFLYLTRSTRSQLSTGQDGYCVGMSRH